MQYLASLLVPAVLFLLARGRWSLFRLGLASLVLTYAVTVATAFALSAWYSHRANVYDLNHDGVISLAEQSPSQSAAQELAVNDAGRNLTVLFAAPWALLVSGSFLTLAAIARWHARRQRQHPGSAAEGAKPHAMAPTERDA